MDLLKERFYFFKLQGQMSPEFYLYKCSGAAVDKTFSVDLTFYIIYIDFCETF